MTSKLFLIPILFLLCAQPAYLQVVPPPPPPPVAITEARLVTPLDPSLSAATYAPQLVVFVGVKNPAIGVTYVVSVSVQARKQAYTASGLIPPPIAPNTMSATMLPIPMQPGETLPPNPVVIVNVFQAVTGPTGDTIPIKIN